MADLNFNARLLCWRYVLPCNEEAKLSEWEDGYDLIIIVGTQDGFDFHVEDVKAFIAALTAVAISGIQSYQAMYHV